MCRSSSTSTRRSPSGRTTSVEALVAAIVGGMGTLWGPGAGRSGCCTCAGRLITRNLFGQLPGINLVIYGVVLVLIIMFMPRGISGRASSLQGRLARMRKKSRGAHMAAEPHAARCDQHCRIAFGGLKAVQNVSLDAAARAA